MISEFTKIGPNRVSSTRGFSVTFHPAGGVDYSDGRGTIRIDTELHVKPLCLHLYRQSRSLRTLPDSRVDEILTDVLRALEYLGHPTKISQPL